MINISSLQKKISIKMSIQRCFIFHYHDIQKSILYDINRPIEGLLREFLIQTNSIVDLDFTKIFFRWRTHILNSPDNLNKKISEIIGLRDNQLINVNDTCHVVGYVIYNNDL